MGLRKWTDLLASGDDLNNVGCDDEEDAIAEEVDEAMNEIERRSAACGQGYPFALESQGTVVRHTNEDRVPDHIYRYLLLSTRLNMLHHKMQAGIDGTALLEELSAEVLKSYLGRKRAQAFVFGTATRGGFEGKVTDLCLRLGEGGKFRNLDTAKSDANDDKLDAVAWIPFSDKHPSQLVIFGQCKTGTNWKDHIGSTRPEAFIQSWMETPFIVMPLRAFCISESADRSHWRHTASNAGLLLDRCRLVDFSEEVDPTLLQRIRTWTQAALQLAVFPADGVRLSAAAQKKTRAAAKKKR